MHSLITLMIFLTIVIFFIAIGYLLYEFLHSSAHQRYVTVYNNYRKRKNQTHKCPSGCVRGVCEYGEYCRHHYPPNPRCCAFNFQCQNCKDPETGNIYRPGDEEDLLASINANYYTANSPSEINELNREIARQNQYVKELNKRVKRQNERVLETQY